MDSCDIFMRVDDPSIQERTSIEINNLPGIYYFLIGRSNPNVEPLPNLFFTHTWPPCSSIIVLTIQRPRPELSSPPVGLGVNITPFVNTFFLSSSESPTPLSFSSTVIFLSLKYV